jgi:hypothetical protein
MNMKNTYLQNILIAETFAILVESIYFYKVCKIKSFKAFIGAFVANLISWQFAPALTYLFFK